MPYRRWRIYGRERVWRAAAARVATGGGRWTVQNDSNRMKDFHKEKLSTAQSVYFANA